MVRLPRRSGLEYWLAVASVAVATLIQLVIHPLLGGTFSLLPYYGAVIFSAWYGGFRPAAVALILSCLVDKYLFVEPRYSFELINPWEFRINVALFLFVGLATALLSESLMAARRRAERNVADLADQHRRLEQEMAQRRHAEEEQQRLALRNRAILETMLDGLITMDFGGAIQSCNPAAERLFGYPTGELLGQNLSKLMPLADQQRHQSEFLENYLEGGKSKVLGLGREVIGLRKDGTIFPLELSLSEDHSDDRPMLIGLLHDLTERKRNERSLKEAKEAAERANAAKGQFLAGVSHELRTPMNSIIGMTELALDESLPDSARDCLETVKTSADLLLAMVNEILDYSRLESGGLTLESEPFKLRRTLDQLIRSMTLRAAEKDLKLAYRAADDVPEELSGDATRLRQVLRNLLDNAVKFTEQGEIACSVGVESRADGEVDLRFAISDTGIGIAPGDQRRIFSPFYQVDSSTTRKHGGAGLGLAIASDLVKLAGGRIWVESEQSTGSTFCFTMRMGIASAAGQPYDRSAAADRPADTRLLGAGDRLRQLRVLVAEDIPANQKLLRKILDKRGHQVEIASNGKEAVDLASHEPFDLVLMDVQMPRMDGYQAAAAIRSQPGHRRLPIVAMTAYAMPGDRERCLAAGMDAYLSKPVDSRRLIDLIERLAAHQCSSLAACEEENLETSRDNLKPEREASPATVFDLEGTLKRLGGNRDLLADLVQMFGEDAPKLLERIADAMHSGRADSVRLGAHSLRGLASNFGADALMQRLLRIEEAATRGSLSSTADLEEVRQQTARLKVAIEPHRRAAPTG